MSSSWIANIDRCEAVVAGNRGPRVLIPVVGSRSDAAFWKSALTRSAPEVQNADGRVAVAPAVETRRLGNLLGTLAAWSEAGPIDRRDVALISMVVGQGKRLSPFTQALGNRKAAFPTPRRGSDGAFLTMCEVANFSVCPWADVLRDAGFRGVIVKWGDEAVVPGVPLTASASAFGDVDVVRLVGDAEPTDELARQKEWIVTDSRTGDVAGVVARQPHRSLIARLDELGGADRRVGINLGSLAIGHDLITIIHEAFADALERPGVWIDWDPYFWIALACETRDRWRAEGARERAIGKSDLDTLEARVPDFVDRVHRVRDLFRDRLGRPIRQRALAFGEPLWIDLGQQTALREHMEALLAHDDHGAALRRLHRIGERRDARGNIVVDGLVAPDADVRDSIIIGSTIADGRSRVHRGVILGSRIGRVDMPRGGALIECVLGDARAEGEGAIAFRSLGDALALSALDRHTSLVLGGRVVDVRGSETLRSYDGEAYEAPVLGNTMSFAELATRAGAADGRSLADDWMRHATRIAARIAARIDAGG